MPDLAHLRQTLAQMLATGKYDGAPPWFEAAQWLHPALGSTDAAVADFLHDNPPHRLPAHAIPIDSPDSAPVPPIWPGAADELLRQASTLLDRCLSRHQDLVALEAQAVTTFLELLSSQAEQPLALALSRVELKANRALAHAGAGDADEQTLVKQDELQTRLRQMRMSMHGEDGHPLNFGQRIRFLRELQAGDVRAVLERLYAVQLCVASVGWSTCFGQLPTWDGQAHDNLIQLVRWVRETLRGREEAQALEDSSLHVFALGANGLIAAGAGSVGEDLAKPGASQFVFHLPSALFAEGQGAPRILGASVHLVFGDNLEEVLKVADSRVAHLSLEDASLRLHRQHWRASAKVTGPVQRAVLPSGESYEWACPPWRMGAAVMAMDDTSLLDTLSVQGNPLVGASPVGTWRLTVEEAVITPSGPEKLSELIQRVSKDLCKPTDIVLALRLAQRR